ncbi:MAG: efflux system, outer rane lipoprotein NodT family [Caulobacter sp.]|nr:efflux system, outer rane lipoprotein NodT family [Caulobacter sp.]
MSLVATGAAPRPRPHRMRPSVALALAGLTLAACATTPPRQADTRLPAAFEAPAGRTLDAVALQTWWTSFNDPELTALVETALARSPDARSAAARLDEARAVRRGQINQLYIPSTPLTGSASRTHTQILDQSGQGFTQPGDSENYGLNFDVSWELDLIGRRRAARGVVNNDLAAARFNAEGARASLAANVAQSYFQARGLAVQLRDAQENARIAGALQATAAERARRGLSAESDADRTAADLAQSQAQVAGLEAQLQVARRSLLILVGRGVDPLASLPVAAEAANAPPVPAAVPGDLLVRRPDVREAQARLASAAANLKVNQLALFPTFTITPGIGLSKAISPSFLGTGAQTSTTSAAWTLGANVSIPVLNLPKLMNDIDAQGARVEQAALAYEKAVQTAYGEAEGALTQLSADQRQVALLKAGEARAQAAYAAARKGYAAGLTDLTTALQAEQAWRTSRSSLTSARTQALQRAVQTYKALGGGWTATPLPDQAQAASPVSSR